ncbi:unnamed protein product [Rhizophagus irregularis]|nr:unnamed protein product [Rhizophagus irregularis]
MSGSMKGTLPVNLLTTIKWKERRFNLTVGWAREFLLNKVLVPLHLKGDPEYTEVLTSEMFRKQQKQQQQQIPRQHTMTTRSSSTNSSGCYQTAKLR